MKMDVRKVLVWFFPLSVVIAYWSIVGAVLFCALLSVVFALLSGIDSEKSGKTLSFVEKVQRKLKLGFVRVSIKKMFGQKVMGGFTIPVLPAFVNVRYKDEQSKLEAIIHEHVHIYYFIYGFQIALLWLLIFFIHHWHLLLQYVFIFLFLMLQEFLTHRKTKLLGSEFDVDVHFFTSVRVAKYVIIYGVFLGFAYLCFSFVSFPLNIIFFFLIVSIINKFFSRVFKWFKLKEE